MCAVGLYLVSTNDGAYELTTPHTMAHHVLLRKIYAVLAFALLGFLLERSNLRRVRGVLAAALALTLYSYAIELGQIVFDASTETFAEHAFDVASGTAGGALGAFVALLVSERRVPARRIEALALALVFAALYWGYLLTYARMD